MFSVPVEYEKGTTNDYFIWTELLLLFPYIITLHVVDICQEVKFRRFRQEHDDIVKTLLCLSGKCLEDLLNEIVISGYSPV